MTAAVRRLLKELQDTQNDPSEEIVSLAPVDDESILRWRAVLRGPRDSPYEGGCFELRIDVPEQYPIRPPTL
ncbi:E2 ubiquitin-protein ligase peroxin 4, partial [Coemansia sp. RSA 2673]